MLSFLGMVSFLFAALDAACSLAGWPLTTLSWSPALFGVLGLLLITLEALERQNRPGRYAPTSPDTRPRPIR